MAMFLQGESRVGLDSHASADLLGVRELRRLTSRSGVLR